MAFVTAAKLAGFAVRICHTFDLDAFLALANGRADAVRVARALHLFARVAFTHEVGGAEFLVAVRARLAFHLKMLSKIVWQRIGHLKIAKLIRHEKLNTLNFFVPFRKMSTKETMSPKGLVHII